MRVLVFKNINEITMNESRRFVKPSEKVFAV